MNTKRATYLKVVSVFACSIFFLNVISTQLWQEDVTVLDVHLCRGTSPQSSRSAYVAAPPQVTSYFPPPDDNRKDYHEWNAQTLRELHTCMALGNCGANQQKVALLAAHWFEEAVVRGWRGGEGVWYARAIIQCMVITPLLIDASCQGAISGTQSTDIYPLPNPSKLTAE